jgi:hypothetical protein
MISLVRRLSLALALALGACATTPSLVPGQSTEADVRATMGPPTETRALPGGERVLWYARPVPDTAYGSERVAVTLAPDGKLRSVEQRLAPQYIAKVLPGQSKAGDVRDLIGPPSRSYRRIGKPGEVWEYELQGFQRPVTLYVELSPEQVVEAVYTLERSSVTSDGPRRR